MRTLVKQMLPKSLTGRGLIFFLRPTHSGFTIDNEFLASLGGGGGGTAGEKRVVLCD